MSKTMVIVAKKKKKLPETSWDEASDIQDSAQV